MLEEPATIAPAIPRAVEQRALEVLKMACERHLGLVTAESCTGGLLAALLTDIQGCSHAFERGFVCYTDEAKTEMLKVPAELIRTRGAVSAEVAQAMALGALAASNGHIALAITGYTESGPDGEEGGLVFFGAASRRSGPSVHEHHFGDIGRGAVRVECLAAGLEILWRRILSG